MTPRAQPRHIEWLGVITVMFVDKLSRAAHLASLSFQLSIAYGIVCCVVGAVAIRMFLSPPLGI
jgi:hypothetical protein